MIDNTSIDTAKSTNGKRCLNKKSYKTILYDILLFWNCFIHIPMWAMLFYIICFSYICYKSYPYIILRYILILYITYCCCFDNTNRNIAIQEFLLKYNLIENFRNLFSFKLVQKYFPVQLINTNSDNIITPENGPYIFLYHPHGIISIGANTALNTNGCKFNILFPNIIRWNVTLNIIFKLPIFREIIILLGFINANKNTIKYFLKIKKQSIILIPGGSIEALYINYNKIQLYNNRKGFIRLALETNSKLIPIICFGENKIFSILTNDNDKINNNNTNNILWLHKIQKYLCKKLSFSIPILLSPFPKKIPLTVIVGKPITYNNSTYINNDNIISNENECVEEYYLMYKKAVEELYNEHREAYGYKNIPLEWVS